MALAGKDPWGLPPRDSSPGSLNSCSGAVDPNWVLNVLLGDKFCVSVLLGITSCVCGDYTSCVLLSLFLRVI